MTEFNSGQVQRLAKVLQEMYGFATVTQLDRAVADVLKRTSVREARGGNLSLSKIIRGLRVVTGGNNAALPSSDPQEDVKYLETYCQKVLTTGTTPGQYLVPTIGCA